MQIDTPQILSIIALFAAFGAIGWMKVLSARAFKSIDDKLLEIKSSFIKLEVETKAKLDTLTKDQRVCIADIIRSQEHDKIVEQANSQLRNEVNREVQLITQHIDTIHNKITQIDNKFEKMRDRGK